MTRVFSNAPGNYGTNVNFMVMDSQWETDEHAAEICSLPASALRTRAIQKDGRSKVAKRRT